MLGLVLAPGDAPRVVLVDAELESGTAEALCRRLRESNQPCPVLVLARVHSVAQEVAVLEAGADDYLVYPHDLDTLVARIRALALRASRRTTPESARERRIGRVVFRGSAPEVLVDGEPCELTARELVLLELLVTRAGEVVARSEILERWGLRRDTSNILGAHLSSLRRKLGKASSQLCTIRSVGFALVAGPEP